MPVIKLDEQIHPVKEFMLDDIIQLLEPRNPSLAQELRQAQFQWPEPELTKTMKNTAMHLLCNLDNLFEYVRVEK